MKSFTQYFAYTLSVAVIIIGGVSMAKSAHADGLGSVISSAGNAVSNTVTGATAPALSTPAPTTTTAPTPAESASPTSPVPSAPVSSATNPLVAAISNAITPIITAITPVKSPITVSTQTSTTPAKPAHLKSSTGESTPTPAVTNTSDESFPQQAVAAVASIAGLSGNSSTATSSATTTITMGAAAIINDTFGSPANVQGDTTAVPQNIYAQPTTLPLHETLAWLCLSLAFFVIGIVCIRRDTMAFMGAYNLSPQFSRKQAVIR
jgi:hypothetical protein